MGAIFSPRANFISRVVLFGLALTPLALGAGGYAWYMSSYRTDVGMARTQPVPFSHAHHVGGLGIDCRYCHRTAEKSAFAGIPETDTCMQCHWQVWTEAPLLEPVRNSWRTGKPLRWQRVHDTPDYVFFDHSVHVNNGVGCSECHGRVDQMPLMWKSETMYMQWCLDCHRDPGPRLRPPDEIYNIAYDPGRRVREQQADELMQQYDIHTEGLTNCSACHR